MKVRKSDAERAWRICRELGRLVDAIFAGDLKEIRAVDASTGSSVRIPPDLMKGAGACASVVADVLEGGAEELDAEGGARRLLMALAAAYADAEKEGQR